MKLKIGEAIGLTFFVAIASMWAHYAVGVNAAHPEKCETKVIVQDNATVIERVNCRPPDLQILLVASWVLSVFGALATFASKVEGRW